MLDALAFALSAFVGVLLICQEVKIWALRRETKILRDTLLRVTLQAHWRLSELETKVAQGPTSN